MWYFFKIIRKIACSDIIWCCHILQNIIYEMKTQIERWASTVKRQIEESESQLIEDVVEVEQKQECV